MHEIINLKRERVSFCLMVLEVPIHEQADPLLLAPWWECWTAMVGSIPQSKTIHLMAGK
jgi:hypothetical protein